MTSLREFVAEVVAVASDASAEIELLATSWPDGPPTTLLMSWLAKVVVQTFPCMTESHRSHLFAAVEDALHDGDDQLKDAVATGFLEGLIVEVERNGQDSSAVRVHAGPLAQDYLRAWDKFSGA